MSPQVAAGEIISATDLTCQEINAFSERVFRTRGGRIGSGMGTLLEALWGYYVTNELSKGESTKCELVWLIGHEYNDFACIEVGSDWNSMARETELLRVEAKSMNADADESKGHFDELYARLGAHDLLLVLIWRWKPIDSLRNCPWIEGHYIGPARPIAYLRDELHLLRSGSFVDRAHCPDGCDPAVCTHHGEPLNASGNRERRTGPASCRSGSVAYAANFGGLVRMLYANSDAARRRLHEIRASSEDVHRYISLLHRHYPRLERGHYTTAEWRSVARSMKLPTEGKSKADLAELVRSQPGYMEQLRQLGQSN